MTFQVQTMSNSACCVNMAYSCSQITSRMICAAGSGKDSCQGDSGGKYSPTPRSPAGWSVLPAPARTPVMETPAVSTHLLPDHYPDDLCCRPWLGLLSGRLRQKVLTYNYIYTSYSQMICSAKTIIVSLLCLFNNVRTVFACEILFLTSKLKLLSICFVCGLTKIIQ